MSRLPVLAFGALVLATVAAFFVTQHLKVTTPLLAGFPAPTPAVINPLDGATCGGVNHRFTHVSFYLLHRSDDVDVYVTSQNGAVVRTLASGRHMRIRVRNPDGNFVWNGRLEDGSVAPDGTYYIKVALIHQGRTVVISNSAGPEPVRVKTIPPRPVVQKVSPQLIPQGGNRVTITYSGEGKLSGTVRIYRTDLPGRPKLVKSFVTPWNSHTAVWDGLIRRRPAPAGTYLVGLDMIDSACNTGRFPPVMPPPPHSTPRVGVTVRYLAAQPPLDPVNAGARAVVYVDSRQQPYRWALRLAGAHKVLSSGSSRQVPLSVRAPARVSGLYEVAVRSGPFRTLVPLVANGSRHARALVVLPALTWQGLNPVDDDGDGLPDTLDAGGPIRLARPLAEGLPAGLADEAALLAYLTKTHRAFDLTTDLGLIDGAGPTLSGHRAVILAGSERWIPTSLAFALREYVQRGGHVLSLGLDSLLRRVTVRGGVALNPTQPSRVDALGARPGAFVAHDSALVTEIRDGLGIFRGTAGVFPAFHSYQPFAVPDALSAAGTATRAPAIVGYRLGRGVVVDVGLPAFASKLAHSVDAQELFGRLWTVLGGA